MNSGKLCVSYGFSMDGECFSGEYNYDVTVTKRFRKDNRPREVLREDGVYFRYTKKNGWREYNHLEKKYRDYRGTGTRINFTMD
jgi:hypothetical protein